MGATDKGIPYVEPDDLIAGWPAADKLQAEKIDDLIGDNAQDIADNSQELADLKDAVESNAQDIATNADGISTNADGIAINAGNISDLKDSLAGGDINEVLTKQSGTDGDYAWLPSQGGGGGGGGGDYPGISKDAGNIIVLGDDAGLYANPSFDMSQPGIGNDFGTTGPPVQLYGLSRPDEFGTHGGAITAPIGSTYTCVNGSPPMEATHWRQVAGRGDVWNCVESRYALYGVPIDGPTGDNFFLDGENNTANFFLTGGRVAQLHMQGRPAKQFLSDLTQIGTFSQKETVNGSEVNLIKPYATISFDVQCYGSPYDHANLSRQAWIDPSGRIYVRGGDWDLDNWAWFSVSYLIPLAVWNHPYPTAPPVFTPTTVTSLEAQIHEAEQRSEELDPSVVHLDAWKKQLTDMESKL